MIDPLYSLSGFAVGLLLDMTGVGGGSLIADSTAVGTDLLVHGFARRKLDRGATAGDRQHSRHDRDAQRSIALQSQRRRGA